MRNLDDLPTTQSGAVRKDDALAWLEELRGADVDFEDLAETIVPKPYEFEGSTHATPISNIRLTGSPEFITKVAALFADFVEFEAETVRLSINLQELEDRETGKKNGAYALYLSVCERGRESAIANTMLQAAVS